MTQINLIQHSGGSLRQLSNLEGILRRVAWWSLGSLFVVGIATGALYLFARVTIRKLETTKVDVVRDINAQGVKEGLLLSLKERTTIASRILDAAKPWGKLFSVLGEVASEGAFTLIAVDESGQVNASLELTSLDEAVAVVTNTVTLAKERRIRSPQMLSFALRDDGSIQLTMTFHPKF